MTAHIRITLDNHHATPSRPNPAASPFVTSADARVDRLIGRALSASAGSRPARRRPGASSQVQHILVVTDPVVPAI
jgi:hypothetical protein